VKNKIMVIFTIICILGIVMPIFLVVFKIIKKNSNEVERKEYIEYTLLEDGTYEVSNYIWNDKEEKIKVPEEYKGKKVTSIGEFAFCTSEYEKVRYGKSGEEEPTEKLEDKRCIAYEIELPNTIKYIKKYSFSGCYHLMSIRIPDDVDKVEIGAFSECTWLEKIEFNKKIKELGDVVFSECKSLKEIKLPSTVTKLGDGCFAECKSLEKVEMLDGLPNVSKNIFKNCEKLKEIKINENVDIIGEDAFYFCESLKKVIIPDKVKKISEGAFAGCSDLNEIYIGNNVEEIQRTALFISDDAEIFIPKSVKRIERHTIGGENSRGSSKKQTIKCEIDKQPDGWEDDWQISASYNPDKEELPNVLFGQKR